MDNQQESYLVPIPGYVGYLTDCEGNIFSVRRGELKQLKPMPHGGKTKKTYFRVKLATSQVFVHRLIGSILYGDVIPRNLQVNHIDADSTNNRIDNLEVVTQKENVLHAKENKLYCQGAAWYAARAK